jgi:L-ascorbate oxidase
MSDERTTIHWHGHHQWRTPYMDGVPYLTQCPIEPRRSFLYEMRAHHSGTMFWHSHYGVQRADGLFGPFIVREPDKTNIQRKLYDYDLSAHVITINDWTHQEESAKYLDHIQVQCLIKIKFMPSNL